MSIQLLTEAEYKERETYIDCEVLRDAVETLQNKGWERDDILTFLRELLEE